MKTVIGVLAVCMMLPLTVLAKEKNKDVYVTTDAERLSRRVDDLREKVKNRGKEWYDGSRAFLTGATEIEKLLNKLENDRENINLHIHYFKACAAKCAELRPFLNVLLNKKNPTNDVNAMVSVLKEIVAYNQTKEQNFKLLSQNAPSESLRNRYLSMSASAGRIARAYEEFQKKYTDLDINKQIGVFKGELEFLDEFQNYCNEMIVHLHTIRIVGQTYADAERIAKSLSELAQSLDRFSKILSGQYIDIDEKKPNANELAFDRFNRILSGQC